MVVEMLRMNAPALTAVGALNWGLVEFLDFNAVSFVGNALGAASLVDPLVYGAVGLAGGFVLYDMYLD